MGKIRMKKAGFSGKAWHLTWRDFWDQLALECESCRTVHHRSPWPQLRRNRGLRMAELWYCRTECFELALAEILRQENPSAHRESVLLHRIPLGLLLLSRQQLTVAQLRAALDAQRNAGRGKIGEWLLRLGFAGEQEITAALARQWSCPVLGRNLEDSAAQRATSPIPMLLLEAFQMIPVEFAEATGTLLIAFGEGVDRGVLYAIERMLGYRAEACLVCPSVLRRALESLAQRHRAGDVVFDRMGDTAECARIIASYAAKVGAEKVRLARCGQYLWIRLERPVHEPVNLVLRCPQVSTPALSFSSAALGSLASTPAV